MGEVQWSNHGHVILDDVDFYNPRTDDTKHNKGVRVDSSKCCVGICIDFSTATQVPGKFSSIELHSSLCTLWRQDDDEIEKFYDQINITIQLTKSGGIKILSGNWNVKVGQGPHEQSIPEKVTADRLIQFCKEH